MQGMIVDYVSGAWKAFLPDGSEYTTGSSPYRIQDALDYSRANSLSLDIFGRGPAFPFTYTNTTLTMPKQDKLAFRAHDSHFAFSNGAQDGIVFDTQLRSIWDNSSGSITYNGTGKGVVFRPQSAMFYSSGAATSPWSADMVFDLGFVQAVDGGSSPAALVCEDVTAVVGTDGYTASQFINNLVRYNALQGWNKPNVCLWIMSPTSGFQNGGQNHFAGSGLIQGAANVEICTGSSSNNPLDGGIGTNEFSGPAIAHVKDGSGTFAILANAKQDKFRFNSIAAYTSGANRPSNLVYWGPNGSGIDIDVKQAFGWTSAIDHYGGSVPSWPNKIHGYDSAHP